MSTRSQLRFIMEVEAGDDRIAQVYKHSDGYPEGVLPMLDDVRTMGRDDPEYAAANFIFLGKLALLEMAADGDPDEAYRLHDPDEWGGDDAPVRHRMIPLSYGVEAVGRWHGDEEYLYEVVTHSSARDGWFVRVSGHNAFPRWDMLGDLDDDADAWDHVEWAFEGSLDEAIERFVGEE